MVSSVSISEGKPANVHAFQILQVQINNVSNLQVYAHKWIYHVHLRYTWNAMCEGKAIM